MNADRNQTLEPPVDDSIRRQAIASLTRQRLFISCVAFVVTACAVYMNLTHKRAMIVRGFTDIGAVLLWLMMFRIAASLRTLTTPEPTEKEKDEKAEKLIKAWRPPAKLDRK